MEWSSGLVYGVSASLQAMSILPWIMAALAAALLCSTRASFSRRWWDGPRRALFALATLGALLTVGFLVRWNYLPTTF